MYIYPQFMQSSDKFHFGRMLPAPADSTTPQTEGSPFVPETTKIIIIPDPLLIKSQVEENTEAILDLKKEVEILKTYKVGEKYSLYALNYLNSKKLQLKKSLSIVLKENPDGFIAKLSDINAWGQGETEQEATENLCLYGFRKFIFLSKRKAKKSRERDEKRVEIIERIY